MNGEPGVVVQGGMVSGSACAGEPSAPAATELVRKNLRLKSPPAAPISSGPAGGWLVRLLVPPPLKFASGSLRRRDIMPDGRDDLIGRPFRRKEPQIAAVLADDINEARVID